MRLLITIVMISLPSLLWAQEKNFLSTDDKRMVVQGDVINIKADTAFVINKSIAAFLNQKLDELAEIQILYNDIVDNRNQLVVELKTLEAQLVRLERQLERDEQIIDEELTTIISEMDIALADLKQNNQVLKGNNDELQTKVHQLERIVKELRKEIRNIWWNGLTDKLVAFGVGVAAGALIIIIL